MTSSIELRFSRRAEANIRNILQYTRYTWGKDQEELYQNTLRDAFRRIQAFPDIGKQADESRPNLREYQLEHHLILYRREPRRSQTVNRSCAAVRPFPASVRAVRHTIVAIARQSRQGATERTSAAPGTNRHTPARGA